MVVKEVDDWEVRNIHLLARTYSEQIDTYFHQHFCSLFSFVVLAETGSICEHCVK